MVIVHSWQQNLCRIASTCTLTVNATTRPSNEGQAKVPLESAPSQARLRELLLADQDNHRDPRREEDCPRAKEALPRVSPTWTVLNDALTRSRGANLTLLSPPPQDSQNVDSTPPPAPTSVEKDTPLFREWNTQPDPKGEHTKNAKL